MNVVDSSGWLEYFRNGPNSGFFSAPIEKSDQLIVPTISIYEVFKRVLQQKNETDALRAVAFMKAGLVVDLTSTLALHSAKLSFDLRIPMADSIMLATAREYEAILWTQDADFEGMAGVKFIHRS
jgi:toxin FitB